MTFFCTSDEVLSGALPKRKCRYKDVVVTDFEMRFHIGYGEPERQKYLKALKDEPAMIEKATLSVEDDRYRMVFSYDEFLEKLRILRDGLNDRALELVKYQLKRDFCDKYAAKDIVVAEKLYQSPLFYEYDPRFGPVIRQNPVNCFKVEAHVRRWHDLNLKLLMEKPVSRFLTMRAVPVNMRWADECTGYFEEEITQFFDREGSIIE